MKLEQMTLTDYRNIGQMSLAPDPVMNVVYGDNAQGKTNLIEAIWLFTGNSSFRGAKSSELVRFGKEEARLSVRFSDREREQEAELSFGSRRQMKLNRVELKTASELNGNFFAVVFSPAHLSFIKDGPKFRRRFLDIAISQIRPQYEGYAELYERLLEQRNALLRNAGSYYNLAENIEVWDMQLAKAGTILSIYRADYVRKLRKLADEIYKGLSADRESLELSYQSTVYDNPETVTAYTDEAVGQYLAKLRESFPADLKQGFTTAGIHRDDMEVKIDGKPARVYGSQGQQRSAVIALKLAEAKLLQKATGEPPVMLLDDVMSELDASRQSYILNHLKDLQVFLTCCDRSNTLLLERGRVFHIREGGLAGEETIGEGGG